MRHLSLETRHTLATARAARFLSLSMAARDRGDHGLALANAEAYGRWDHVASALGRKLDRAGRVAGGIL